VSWGWLSARALTHVSLYGNQCQTRVYGSVSLSGSLPKACCQNWTLLQHPHIIAIGQLIRLPPDAQSSQQPIGFQDSLLGQVGTLQLLIYHS
jgi:hypothetical protein